MQADKLVAEHVAAGGNGRRNLDRPLIAVGDELVRRPLAGRRGSVDQTLLCDLEEAEVARLRAGAAAGALGEVVDHGTVMGVRPGVPAQGNGRPSGDGDLSRAGRGGLVAGDVAGAESVWGDEAIVLVQGEPTGALWLVALLVEPALLLLTCALLTGKDCHEPGRRRHCRSARRLEQSGRSRGR